MLNSSKPVIRWIKGDGLDDPVTRAAIGQATRLFGDRIQYCLTANGITPDRARRVLDWAARPVELRMQSPDDNPHLAEVLRRAGCAPQRFGYWWKWFPARICAGAPEMVLDGDIVIVREPRWFARWLAGGEEIRVTADPRCGTYGQYKDLVDGRRLYSGLLCFPPGFDFRARLMSVLRARPLMAGHDGTRNTSEQGCVAAAFADIEVEPIPLHELPFGRAFEPFLDYGPQGRSSAPWGYHFGRAFTEENRHFTALVEAGEVYHRADEVPAVERLAWLREHEPPDDRPFSSDTAVSEQVARLASAYCSRSVLLLNAGRGYLAALLAERGCRIAAVSSVPSEIRSNLGDAGVEALREGSDRLPPEAAAGYALVVADMPVRTVDELRSLWNRVSGWLQPSGELLALLPESCAQDAAGFSGARLRLISPPADCTMPRNALRPGLIMLRKM